MEFIAAHLNDPLPQLSEDKIAELIPDLKNGSASGTDTYEQIAFQGAVAAPVLKRALAGPDVVIPSQYHWQLYRLLTLAINYTQTPQQTRNFRAKNLLDAIHSPAAIELAKTIPDFDPPVYTMPSW